MQCDLVNTTNRGKGGTPTLLMRILASAVSPANAIMTWSSSRHIFWTVRSSCSLATAFFSTPSTTTPGPRTPTAVEPFFTASCAYSTCREKLSKRMMLCKCRM